VAQNFKALPIKLMARTLVRKQKLLKNTLYCLPLEEEYLESSRPNNYILLHLYNYAWHGFFSGFLFLGNFWGILSTPA
jgi:hypothetical protein